MTARCWHSWATTGRSWVTKTRLAPGLPAQLGQQPQDLVLDRHVERGGRLVAQDDLGVAGQRDGDHHPLPHAAGELVRVGAEPPLRVGDADPAHQLDGPLGGLGPAEAEVHLRALGDLRPDPHHRVQRAHRLLEDHRDLGPADPVESSLAHRDQVHPVQQDLPGGDLGLAGSTPRMARSVMLLPEPDSPTRPTASPRGTSRETPSTAWTTPRRLAISTCRSLTSSTGFPARPLASPPCLVRAS